MEQLNCTLSEEQRSNLAALFERGSFDTLKHCVKGVDEMDYFQTVAIAYSVLVEACLLNLDTGLGKTLIAAGIMNVVNMLYPRIRWIYLCQCSNLKTTADKLKRHLYNDNILYCDSTEKAILNNFCTYKAASADIIVLSYEAITEPSVEGFLFDNRQYFQGVILDESQMLSNLSSHTSKLISAIINSARFKILLSATPLRVSVEQVINQMYMLDRKMFEGVTLSSFLNQYRVWADKEVIGYRNLDHLESQLMDRMLSLSRTDLDARGDYTPYMHICQSGLADDAKITDIVNCKCEKYSAPMLKLLDIVKRYKAEGKRGLIYANRNTIKKAVKYALETEDLAVDIMDGTNTATQKKKDIVHRKFLNKELDVLITNITTGKDLPCDYIIFYELTFDYKQMIGRGERGLQGVDLDVHFILTDSVYEMRFFYANVYQRGVLLEQLCGKDLPELHGALKQLEAELKRKGVSINDLFDQQTT